MFTEFFKARDDIQLPIEEMDLYKLTDIYNKGIKAFNGDQAIKDYLIWDYELMNCVERPLHTNKHTEKRLVAFFVWENGSVWPDIDNFQKDRNQFYDACIDNTQNKAMKIRYLDYLVDYGENSRKFSYAKKLVEEIKPFCIVKDENYVGYFSKISRLADIAVRFGMTNVISDAEDNMISEATNIATKKQYRWIFEISDLLYFLCYHREQKRIKQTTINQIIVYLSQAREYFSNLKDLYLYQTSSLLLHKWYKAEKYSEDDCKQILIQIGEAFEEEAEYQNGSTEKSEFTRAHFLELAVQNYIDIGERTRIPDLKVKIKKAYKTAAQTELKQISTKLDIPIEVINGEIAKFKNDDIDKSLELLSRTRYFLPIKNNIKKQTEEIKKEAIFTYLFNVSSIYDDRKIFQSENEEETFKYHFYQHYDLDLKLQFGIYFIAVWDELIKNGLTLDKVTNRVTDWEYMNDESKVIIEQGIQRLFEGDFISAIHILTPRFENCFREFFEWGGYATTSVKSKVVQYEQNFNDFLLNEFVKANIDEDFLFFIRFVMVEDIGYNLRNNIAHGLANLEIFNKRNALILIYLFFMLTNFEWKTSSELEALDKTQQEEQSSSAS